MFKNQKFIDSILAKGEDLFKFPGDIKIYPNLELNEAKAEFYPSMEVMMELRPDDGNNFVMLRRLRKTIMMRFHEETVVLKIHKDGKIETVLHDDHFKIPTKKDIEICAEKLRQELRQFLHNNAKKAVS